MGTSAPKPVAELVERFERDRKVFLSPDYKEEQLRAEFLNGPCLTIRHSEFGIRTFPGPFFTAIGWDMDDALDTIRPRNWEVSLFSPDRGIS